MYWWIWKQSALKKVACNGSSTQKFAWKNWSSGTEQTIFCLCWLSGLLVLNKPSSACVSSLVLCYWTNHLLVLVLWSSGTEQTIFCFCRFSGPVVLSKPSACVGSLVFWYWTNHFMLLQVLWSCGIEQTTYICWFSGLLILNKPLLFL